MLQVTNHLGAPLQQAYLTGVVRHVQLLLTPGHLTRTNVRLKYGNLIVRTTTIAGLVPVYAYAYDVLSTSYECECAVTTFDNSCYHHANGR